MSRSPSSGAGSRSAVGNGILPSGPGSRPHKSEEAPGGSVVQRDASTGADVGTGSVADSLPASAGAVATGHFHDVLGNGLLLDAMSGQDSAGFGGMVAGEVTAALGGVHARGLESNQAMAQAMRDAITPEAHDALASLQIGGGHPIPELHRERMERAFDHDFGHVRLHTDAKAAKASEAISAYAFAIGSDIFFGRGTFALGSSQGDRLLAHELTHVVQHDEGRIKPVGSDQDAVSSPSDPLEREAYGNEVRILNLLHQVDAELRAEATGQDQQQELQQGPQSLSVQSETSADDVEVDVADVGTASQLDLAGPDASQPDAESDAGAEIGMDGLDVGGFTAAGPPSDGADGAGDEPTAEGQESGPAMRDARATAQVDTDEAQEHIKKSRGVRIDAQTAARLSGVLGYDISHAVLHTDSAAAAAAEALQANAFALGADVFFAEGAYRPGTAQGDELLAHELTHVVQHEEGRLSGGSELEVSSPSDSLEHEARQAGDRATDASRIIDDALSWGEPAAPDAVSQHVSSVLGFDDTSARALGPSELDTLALGLGAGAFSQAALGGGEVTTHLAESDAGLALRDTANAQTGSTQSSETGAPIPEELTFLIAGAELILDAASLIDSLPKDVSIPIDREPLPGLKLISADLKLDADGKPEEGSILAELKIGDMVAADGIKLTVDDEFKVSAEAEEVQLKLGDTFEATASVTLDDALSATVEAKVSRELDAGNGVKLTKAEMSGTYADNKLHIEGDVVMRFGDWVEGTISATYDAITGEEGVDEDLDLTDKGEDQEQAQAPASGSSGSSGASAPSGDSGGGGGGGGGGSAPQASAPSGSSGASGPSGGPESTEDEESGEQSTGSVDPEMEGPETGGDTDQEVITEPEPTPLTLPGAGKWNATGTLTQIKDLTKGDLTLKDTSLTVKVTDSVMDTVSATATILAPHLGGKAAGKYDVQGETLFGKGTVDLTEELRLEELGVTLESLHAEAEVKASKLTSIKGNLQATVDYEEQATFQVKGEKLSYEYQEEKFAGDGTVTLMRDLTFGDEDATHLKVLKDASAAATFKDSDVEKINAALDFEVLDSQGQFGKGDVTLERGGGGDDGEASWSGKGSFALTDQYGLPEREEGPLFIKEESTFNVTFAESSPETAELDNVQFELKRPGEGKGRIEGEVEGTYGFKEEKVDGTAQARMVEEWPTEASWGTFTLDKGGQLDVEVKASKFEKLEAIVPFTAAFDKLETPFTIKGEVDGELDAEKYEFTGEISGNLEDDVSIEVGKAGDKFTILQEASAKAHVEANELEKIDFDMHVQYYDAESKLYLDGQVDKGTYTLGDDGGKLDFKGSLNLMRDITQETKSGDMEAKVLAGAGLDVEVEANDLKRIGGGGKFQVWDKGGLLLDGGIKDVDLELDEDPEISGRIDVKTGRHLDFPRTEGEEASEESTGTTFSLRVEQGSGVGGTITENELTKVDGELIFQVSEDEGGQLARGGLKGDWRLDEDKFTGKGDLKLTRDYELETGKAGEGRLEGWSIWLKKDSGVSADMADNKLQEAQVNVGVDFKKEGERMAKGNIEGNYTLGQGDGYTGSANVELIEPIEWHADDTFKYMLTPPTKLGAEAKDSNLVSATGTFIVEAQKADGGEPQIRATAETSWQSGKGLSADADVKVLTDIHIADRDPWDVYLAQDSGGKVSIVEDEMKELSGTLKLRADREDIKMVKGEFEAKYAISDGDDAKIDAKGSIELINDLHGAIGESGYSYVVEKGTKAGGELKDGELTSIDGTVKVRVEDESHFIKAEATGKYERVEGDDKVSVDGKATVTRNKVIKEGDEWKVTLMEKSSAEVKVANNELLKVGGQVNIQVDDTEPFVRGKLDGAWTKDGGTTGEVVGTLLREIDMGTLGEYTFFVEKNSEGSGFMEQDKVTKVGGNIDIRVDDKNNTFLKGNLKGDYVLGDDAGFSGTGRMEVVSEKELGKLDDNTLWVLPGGNANVTITKNALEKFGGDVNLSLRDGKSEYVQLKFDGTYDVGAESFTGGGSAKVTREKKLFGEDSGYSFWLKPASGYSAYAEVTKNKLTKVGGEIPFMVKDGKPEALIEGSASGDYDIETGKFDAKGEVYLGRDVTYELGQGKLVFKEGSGGSGEVKDSKLEKLGGKLDVDIWDGKGKLLNVKAEGEFDAVKSNINWVEGEVSLLRPMEPLGEGVLVIESLTGRARVEDNKLKWAEGEGDFAVPALNDMRGHIRARYENRGGEDIYTGEGTLNFTLFNEPDKGREMKGEVKAELFEGEKFKVKGEVDYAMSEMISGKVGVEMDQEFDPTINASLTVTKELIPAQDLFKMKMDLIPHTDVPIYGPIALGFGARGSMGLSTRPLSFETTIGISNWKPISEESNVPDFEAELALNWGLNFNAMLAAYLTLGLTAGIGSAGAGIRGEALLDVPVDVRPYGKLQGGADEFTGELGIGIKIEPQITLAAVPFVMAQLKGFDPLEHDFTRFETDLGPIFSFEWGTKYTFGDVDKTEDQTTVPQNTPPATQGQTEHSKAPEVGSDQMNQPQAAPGGPQMESGSELAGKSGSERAAEGGDSMSELMETIDTVTVLAEGLGAIAYLLGLLVSIITALITLGPAGMVVVLAWKIVTGELTWDRLVDAVEKVIEAVQTAAELLRPHLPSWLNGVIDFFSGEQPSLIDAFFGADDKIRAEVNAGTYRDFPNDSTGSDMIAEWIDAMTDGICGGADESCILELLYFAEGRGQLHAVLGRVSGGADHLDYKIDGRNSRRFRALMDRNGVQYEQSFW